MCGKCVFYEISGRRRQCRIVLRTLHRRQVCQPVCATASLLPSLSLSLFVYLLPSGITISLWPFALPSYACYNFNACPMRTSSQAPAMSTGPAPATASNGIIKQVPISSISFLPPPSPCPFPWLFRNIYRALGTGEKLRQLMNFHSDSCGNATTELRNGFQSKN